MESAKLILEYLKALVWPFVIICVLVIFYPQLKTLPDRLTKVDSPLGSWTFGTGPKTDEGASATSTHTDVWFDVRPTPLARPECIEKAQAALKRNDFVGGAADPGGMVYAYNGRFVGAIWCGAYQDVVLITVAGPMPKELQSRHSKLSKTFWGGTP
jgi:hypothetical protein